TFTGKRWDSPSRWARMQRAIRAWTYGSAHPSFRCTATDAFPSLGRPQDCARRADFLFPWQISRPAVRGWHLERTPARFREGRAAPKQRPPLRAISRMAWLRPPEAG